MQNNEREAIGGMPVTVKRVIEEDGQDFAVIHVDELFRLQDAVGRSNPHTLAMEEALSVLETLEGIVGVDTSNSFGGIWSKTHYELDGETIYQAELKKSELIEYRQAIASLTKALGR